MTIWNAYCLYRFQTKNVTMRTFHLTLIKDITRKYGDINNNISCSRYTVDQPFRLTEKHFPSHCKSENSRKPLRNCIVCSKNDTRRRSRYECENCNVGLCIVPCFKIYHTQLYY